MREYLPVRIRRREILPKRAQDRPTFIQSPDFLSVTLQTDLGQLDCANPGHSQDANCVSLKLLKCATLTAPCRALPEARVLPISKTTNDRLSHTG